MGANEARHVLAMVEDLGKVLALELYTAAQALDLRRDMINAARDLAGRGDAAALAAKVQGGPQPGTQAVGVAAEAGGDTVDRLFAADLLGQEFRRTRDRGQLFVGEPDVRAVGHVHQLRTRQRAAIESDRFH